MNTPKLHIGGKVGRNVLVEREYEVVVSLLARGHGFVVAAWGTVAVSYPLEVGDVDARIGVRIRSSPHHQAQRRQDFVVQGDVTQQTVLIVAVGQVFLDIVRIGKEGVLPVGGIAIGSFPGYGPLNVDVLILFIVAMLRPRNTPVRPDELLARSEASVVGTGIDVLARYRHVQVFGQVVARVEAEVRPAVIIVVHDALLVYTTK